MTDKEYTVISLTRESVLDCIENTMGCSVRDGLSEKDTEAVAARFGEHLDSLTAASDVFDDAVREVLGDRMQEDEEDN